MLPDIHLILKMLTVVVVDAGQKPRLVYGEHSKAVVPVTSRNKQLVVGGEEEQTRIDCDVLCKGGPNKLPARSA